MNGAIWNFEKGLNVLNEEVGDAQSSNCALFISWLHALMKHGSALNKFRCGVAPLNVVTGRYRPNNILLEERTCFIVTTTLKMNVLFYFTAHCVILKLITQCRTLVFNFHDCTGIQKVSFMSSCPDISILAATICQIVLKHR